MFPWSSFIIVLIHLLILLAWVWRWRRDRNKANLVGIKEQHAFCASCGYDLTGRDVQRVTQVEVTDCPECGRAIRDKTDVIIPKHIKNTMSKKMFVFMVGMQIMIVLMMTSIFVKKYRNPSPFQASNAALIKQITKPSTAVPQTFTTGELTRRLKRGALSTSQSNQLISHALKTQADPTKPWDHELGEWIEVGRSQGLVTDPQWQQYANQPGVIKLLARKRIHPGDPVVLQLESDYTKLRASRNFQNRMSPVSLEDAIINIVPNDGTPDPEALVTHKMRVAALFDNHFIPLINHQTPLPPGKYMAVIETGLEQPDPKPTTTPGQVTQYIRLTAPFEVLPKDQPLLTPVKNPALARSLEKWIRDEMMRTGGTQIKQEKWGTYLSFHLKEPSVPVAGSFVVASPIDAFLNYDYYSFEPNVVGNAWREHTIYLSDDILQRSGNPAKPFEKFTLRFTPDPERIKRRLNGYQYLDHTLWVKDVPMGLPEP